MDVITRPIPLLLIITLLFFQVTPSPPTDQQYHAALAQIKVSKLELQLEEEIHKVCRGLPKLQGDHIAERCITVWLVHKYKTEKQFRHIRADDHISQQVQVALAAHQQVKEQCLQERVAQIIYQGGHSRGMKGKSTGKITALKQQIQQQQEDIQDQENIAKIKTNLISKIEARKNEDQERTKKENTWKEMLKTSHEEETSFQNYLASWKKNRNQQRLHLEQYQQEIEEKKQNQRQKQQLHLKYKDSLSKLIDNIESQTNKNAKVIQDLEAEQKRLLLQAEDLKKKRKGKLEKEEKAVSQIIRKWHNLAQLTTKNCISLRKDIEFYSKRGHQVDSLNDIFAAKCQNIVVCQSAVKNYVLEARIKQESPLLVKVNRKQTEQFMFSACQQEGYVSIFLNQIWTVCDELPLLGWRILLYEKDSNQLESLKSLIRAPASTNREVCLEMKDELNLFRKYNKRIAQRVKLEYNGLVREYLNRCENMMEEAKVDELLYVRIEPQEDEQRCVAYFVEHLAMLVVKIDGKVTKKVGVLPGQAQEESLNYKLEEKTIYFRAKVQDQWAACGELSEQEQRNIQRYQRIITTNYEQIVNLLQSQKTTNLQEICMEAGVKLMADGYQQQKMSREEMLAYNRFLGVYQEKCSAQIGSFSIAELAIPSNPSCRYSIRQGVFYVRMQTDKFQSHLGIIPTDSSPFRLLGNSIIRYKEGKYQECASIGNQAFQFVKKIVERHAEKEQYKFKEEKKVATAIPNTDRAIRTGNLNQVNAQLLLNACTEIENHTPTTQECQQTLHILACFPQSPNKHSPTEYEMYLRLKSNYNAKCYDILRIAVWEESRAKHNGADPQEMNLIQQLLKLRLLLVKMKQDRYIKMEQKQKRKNTIMQALRKDSQEKRQINLKIEQNTQTIQSMKTNLRVAMNMESGTVVTDNQFRERLITLNDPVKYNEFLSNLAMQTRQPIRDQAQCKQLQELKQLRGKQEQLGQRLSQYKAQKQKVQSEIRQINKQIDVSKPVTQHQGAVLSQNLGLSFREREFNEWSKRNALRQPIVETRNQCWNIVSSYQRSISNQQILLSGQLMDVFLQEMTAMAELFVDHFEKNIKPAPVKDCVALKKMLENFPNKVTDYSKENARVQILLLRMYYFVCYGFSSMDQLKYVFPRIKQNSRQLLKTPRP